MKYELLFFFSSIAYSKGVVKCRDWERNQYWRRPQSAHRRCCG